MAAEDYEPRIEELAGKFDAAELYIAGILTGVGTQYTVAQAQQAITHILEELLSLSMEWIEANVSQMYRDGAREAVEAMAVDVPERALQRISRNREHQQSLELLAQNLVDDMVKATTHMNDDAKRRLRDIGRGQLAKALAESHPQARSGDFRAQLEEHGIGITDRSGRKWKAGGYVRMSLRTQTGTVMNAGSLNTALELGSPGVRVFDGGPGDVDEPCNRADGQVWSVAYAMANPLEHPNCRRSFAPLPRSWSGALDREIASSATA